MKGIAKALVLGIAAALFAPSVHAAEINPEEELKSALVLAFVRFSEWPPTDLSHTRTISICVKGRPSLVKAVSRTNGGKPINGRALEPRFLKEGDNGPCHVVLMGQTSGRIRRDTLAAYRAAGTLTIGEDDQFLTDGGMIHIFEDNGRINFEVNLVAVADAGIAISAKLLRLGHVLRKAALPPKPGAQP